MTDPYILRALELSKQHTPETIAERLKTWPDFTASRDHSPSDDGGDGFAATGNEEQTE